MADKKKCSGTIHRDYQFHQCSRRGLIEEDGQLWCKQHAPSAVKARREKSNDRYDLEDKISAMKQEIIATQNIIVDTACRVVDGRLPVDALRDFVAILRTKEADQADMKQRLADMKKK